MSNIRIRLFPQLPPKDWEMDCFVLPSDETNGELVSHNLKIAFDFRKRFEPGLFTALDKLLEQIPRGVEEPKTPVKMVVGRLKDDKRTYWSFRSAEEYSADSPEAKVWALVNSVFDKRLNEKEIEASKCPFKVGDMVKFTPSSRTRGHYQNVEQLTGLKANDVGKITEIRGGIYLDLDNGRGGFPWEEFSSA